MNIFIPLLIKIMSTVLYMSLVFGIIIISFLTAPRMNFYVCVCVRACLVICVQRMDRTRTQAHCAWRFDGGFNL